MAGTCTFIAQVSGTSPAAPNLRPAMKTMLAAFGSFSSCARSSRSAATGSTPALTSASRTPGFAEARHAHHPLARRRTLGEARQRRPHLAADAQHHDVAGRAGKIGDQRVGGRRHEILDGFDAVETGGQCHVEAPSAIGVIDLKSISAPTAKPGTSSERSASLPPAALSRAGRPSFFS